MRDGGAGDGDGVVNGIIQLAVPVPIGAVVTQTFARFRWSTTPGLSSTANATDGEVEDYALTPMHFAAALTLDKTAELDDLDGDGLIDAGETIAYSFLVRNAGQVTLQDVVVDDPMLAGAGITLTPGPQSLTPGQSVTFTATYTPTPAPSTAPRTASRFWLTAGPRGWDWKKRSRSATRMAMALPIRAIFWSIA